jgi:hypothetical protein
MKRHSEDLLLKLKARIKMMRVEKAMIRTIILKKKKTASEIMRPR